MRILSIKEVSKAFSHLCIAVPNEMIGNTTTHHYGQKAGEWASEFMSCAFEWIHQFGFDKSCGRLSSFHGRREPAS